MANVSATLCGSRWPGVSQRLKDWLRRHGEALLTALSALCTAAGWALEAAGLTGPAVWLYVAAFLAGGTLPARDALILLLRERELDVDLLMVLAALGAGAIGHWREGGILIFIFSLSGTLESYAMARTRREISALLALKPDQATVVRDGREVVIPASELQVGDLVLVRPGERIPADGTVVAGESAVNQAAITGESMPVDKGPGDEVFAGTINGHGALTVRCERPAGDTVIARIVRLVEKAREQKPPAQLFVERFERLYSRAVVAATLALWLVPPLLLGHGWQPSFYRATVFMVAASPCAVAMSIMPALLSGIAAAARQGVLLKGARHLENLGAVRVVCFDKTGTLTRGQPAVTDVIPLAPGLPGRAVLRLAAAAERRSEHPLAAAITAAGWDLSPWELGPDEPEEVQALPGVGVRARIGGRTVLVARPEAFPGPVPPQVGALRTEGKTVVAVGWEGEPALGLIALQDEIRPGAAAAVAALRAMGLRTVMLTGDDPRAAAAIARQAGVDEFHAGLLPDEKVARVQELAARYGRVAMVGDGVNDAPALAAAAVGVAMGRRGTDVAMETADVVLMGDDLQKLPYAVALGRRASRIIRQNLAFATLVIALLVISTFAAGMGLPLGVVGHEGSTLLVTLNGLRLLRG